MKSLRKILSKSNLTPRERIITIIKNSAHERITGKSILTKSEIDSISSGGLEYTQRDADEYNKYFFLWRNFKYFEIDVQNLFNTIQLDIANFKNILLLFYYREKPSKFRQVIDDNFENIDKEKGLSLILDKTGLEYDRLVHRYT